MTTLQSLTSPSISSRSLRLFLSTPTCCRCLPAILMMGTMPGYSSPRCLAQETLTVSRLRLTVSRPRLTVTKLRLIVSDLRLIKLRLTVTKLRLSKGRLTVSKLRLNKLRLTVTKLRLAVTITQIDSE